MPGPYDTKLSPNEEAKFLQWKARYAPNDSGEDYDYRGAFRAGQRPGPDGHWVDTFKKPNHPTFSNESQYATGENAAKAGHWVGDKFMPGPVKKPNRPVSSEEFPDKTGPDAVPRVDPSAKKEPRPAVISTGNPLTAPTLVVTGPTTRVAQKDATGMMASKPVQQPVPSVHIMSHDPNMTDDKGAALAKATQDREVWIAQHNAAMQAEMAKEAEKQKLIQDISAGGSVAFGPVGGLAIQKALEAVRRAKAGQK